MNNRKYIAKRFADKINSKYIKQIILFGSVARGDDTTDSDIDILIISSYKNKIRDLINDEVAKTQLNDREFISAHIMSEEVFNETRNFSFIKNVIKEGKIIG